MSDPAETNDQGHTAAAAPTPPASVDFNALNDALAAGKSPEDAVAEAIFPETLALSADEAQAQIDQSEQTAPALGSLNKAALIQVGGDEFVTHAHDADGKVIDFADATNAKMVEAILAKRNGTPILPEDSAALTD